MEKQARIYVAGHRGLVGSALMRRLQADGYTNLITRAHAELDLTDQAKVEDFFKRERPEYVFLAAAKVGGIWANQTYPAEFIYNNLMIQTSVIHTAYLSGVKKLIFFGSTCAYPKECPQPMREKYLLSNYLEPTSEPYAIAKIAGMNMCEAYNRQYGTCFISIIPATLYGPNENFDLETSHVLSALICKFHEAKRGKRDSVVIWGSGIPTREFLYVDDLVDACILLMKLEESVLRPVIEDSGFVINVGSGYDISIMDLAFLIKDIVGCEREPVLDTGKPDGTPRKLLDSHRIMQLGWSPRMSLEEGIRETYEWYKDVEGENGLCTISSTDYCIG